MTTAREKFSSQASPELLAGMREIARTEGRHFQAVLEEAMLSYLENKAGDKNKAKDKNEAGDKVRPEVMAHYRASVERNRLLYELLAQ